MERFLPAGRDGVMQWFGTQFEEVKTRLDDIKNDAAANAADQMFLQVSAKKISSTNADLFSKRSQALMRKVISAEPYGGNCPCCWQVPVRLTDDHQLCDGVEYDHYWKPSMNEPGQGWLICKSCHEELTQGEPIVRYFHKEAFRSFRAAVMVSASACQQELHLQSRPACNDSCARVTTKPRHLYSGDGAFVVSGDCWAIVSAAVISLSASSLGVLANGAVH